MSIKDKLLANKWHVVFFITACAMALLLVAQDASAVEIGARAAILCNLDSGEVLYEKNPDLALPPASLAKIMSLFLTMDDISSQKTSLNQKIQVNKTAATVGGSSLNLKPGDVIPLVRLVAGTAVVSGNDAITAIACHLAGNEQKFVRRMNKKAKNLGLKKTVFKNPTGLPAKGQQTTARDMMLLCQAYLKRHPQVMRFHNMRTFLHRGEIKRNTNTLLGTMPGVNGLKTGWTVASGYHLIITAQRNNTRLLAVVLGSPSKTDRTNSARLLVDAGFRNLSRGRKLASNSRGATIRSQQR